MSRALARLRETTGDPLLVRAGRGLVPSPRAAELREGVARIVEEAQAALRPARRLDLRKVARTFTLRTSEGFAETFGPTLMAAVAGKAPGARLRFLPKTDRDSASLREGRVDLETGVVGQSTGPELRAQALFRDRFIGAVRADHPLARGRMAPARYAGAAHVAVSRRGEDQGPIEAALERAGLRREIAVTVGGFATALALARATDLVATVPERHTAGLREGLHSFALPFAVPEITVSLLWHPRMQADPAHRWLRSLVLQTCAAGAGLPAAPE